MGLAPSVPAERRRLRTVPRRRQRPRERCGSMVNPAKLTAERRDSVCMQCHLEGEARIARAGRSQDDYRPGERCRTTWESSFVRMTRSNVAEQ